MPHLTFRLTVDLDADIVALLGRLVAAAEALAVAAPAGPGPAPETDDAIPAGVLRPHGQVPPVPPDRTRDGFVSLAQREDAAAAAEAEWAPASYETVVAWGDANAVPPLAGDSRIARLRRINARRKTLGLPPFHVAAQSLGGAP